MAKVFKSYELRERPDGKVTLLALNDDGIMETLLKDAKLVVSLEYGKNLPESVGGNDFFLLKKDGDSFLCWVINAIVHIKKCEDFIIQKTSGSLLLRTGEDWYLWKNDEYHYLGKLVLKYGPAFIRDAGKYYEFVYFTPDGKLEKKPCLDYERLEEKIVFSPNGYSGNILRLETKEEGSLFVRIQKVPRCLYHMHGTVPEHYYDFVFVPAESSAE